MTKPKPSITPNREFNAAILDKIISHAMADDQREDEFTVGDLISRDMSEFTAARYCESMFKRGELARRRGRARTGRYAWLYRIKEDATK